MIPLANFLLGSWTGVALSACLFVLPVALVLDVDLTAGILPPVILFAVRMVERGTGKRPLEVLRTGR